MMLHAVLALSLPAFAQASNPCAVSRVAQSPGMSVLLGWTYSLEGIWTYNLSMPDPAPLPAGPLPVVQKKSRGCLFYAAIAAAVVAAGFLFVAVASAVAFNRFVKAYTATAPAALPALVELPVEQADAAAERLKSFNESVKRGEDAPPLSLTGDEINALLARQDRELGNSLRVSIDGDRLKGNWALPLDKAKIPFTGGRYFNGSAAVKASFDNGILIITCDALEINGAPVPDAILSKLKEENLAKNVYKNPKTAEALRKFEKIEVKDGRVTIQMRRGA
ncbi:MAG: hypothetical protein HYZ74_00295 [Elusimicrobia bacterium]|nr:hypothetical protein [Elusimicrobiota bacterium]